MTHLLSLVNTKTLKEACLPLQMEKPIANALVKAKGFCFWNHKKTKPSGAIFETKSYVIPLLRTLIQQIGITKKIEQNIPYTWMVILFRAMALLMNEDLNWGFN